MRRLPIWLLLCPAPLLAQAGFPPSASPYHELRYGGYFEVTGGRLFGEGGLLRLGPRNGNSVGLRYTLRAKNTLQFSFGGWTAATQREVIDADDSVATRDKGLYPQRLIAGEIGIQLNLTGGKTWRGFAPNVGVTFGFVHGAGGPTTDTSGYSFGTKVYFAPGIGTRYFVSQRVYLRFDVRGLFWNLNYPASYAQEPSKQPGTASAPNAVNPTGISSEYTLTPAIRFGLGIAW